MIERRRFHRVRLMAKSDLRQSSSSYHGHLENISLTGALVRFDQGVVVPQWGECVLTVYLEGEPSPLTLVAEVVYVTNSLAGIKFVSGDADTAARLARLVEKATPEPDRLRSELERIRKHFADYLGQR